MPLFGMLHLILFLTENLFCRFFDPFFLIGTNRRHRRKNTSNQNSCQKLNKYSKRPTLWASLTYAYKIGLFDYYEHQPNATNNSKIEYKNTLKFKICDTFWTDAYLLHIYFWFSFCEFRFFSYTVISRTYAVYPIWHHNAGYM